MSSDGNMKITHKLPKAKVQKDCDTAKFTLANGLGSFLFLSDPVASKYNGLIVNYELDNFKILEDIRVKDSDYKEIVKTLDSVSRKGDVDDRFSMVEGIQGLIYKTSKKAPLIIDFDVKRPYDSRQYGRYFKVSHKGKNILVKFTKMTDKKEDSIHLSKEFEIFIVVSPKSCNLNKDYRFVDVWKDTYYPYDESRGDEPFSRHVYQPFEIDAKGFLLAVGRTEEEALDELSRLKKATKKKFRPHMIKNKRLSKEDRAAFLSAQASLSNLEVNFRKIKRLFAGYPWFFQIWTRDESISTIGLMKTGQLEEAKQILLSYLQHIGIDGRIPNRMPSSSLGCADGVGWVFRRLKDLVAISSSLPSHRKNLLSEADMDLIRKNLRSSISLIEKSFYKEGLIYNRPKETWMDTYWNHQDGRDGFCIDIQCQFLGMLSFAYELTKEPKFKDKMERMKTLVRQRFFNGELLADRLDDFTVRPNIFIAYYHFPDLLSRKEWQTVFEKTIGRLWLDWGGLSSIDKQHHLFTDQHTGLDNRSYHRGDSWFWINNLAALCLFRNNAIRFEREIKFLMDASAKEILWHGSIGDHAEVSDACQLSSRGCLSQAWSSALFIQLMCEVYER